MTSFYLESSALVKRYAKERGSNFIVALMRPSAKNIIYSAKITEVEVCAAISRRRKGLTISAKIAAKSIVRFRRVFVKRFFAADLTDAVISEAVHLTDIYALRGVRRSSTCDGFGGKSQKIK